MSGNPETTPGRPIETATPDGSTRVLAWDADDKEWVIATIVMQGDNMEIAARHCPGHWPIRATRWMPLPEDVR